MSLKDLREKVRAGANVANSDSKPPIVIIDDDTQVLASLRIVLKLHYTVYTCSDPLKGAELVNEVKPHAVVLDIRMPERDGFWVYSQIRQNDERVPIIFNSAYQDALDMQDVVAGYQPFAFLSKGGGIQEFLAKIASAVQSSIALGSNHR